MGGTNYSHEAHRSYTNARAAAGGPVFSHSAAIDSGAVDKKVHDDLNPRGASRESRDSEMHPVTLPIAVIFDTTGSMKQVPVLLEERLPRLMGGFLDDRASGRSYLGDAYPAILIGAVDDYAAMGGDRTLGEGCLQIGQFESGIEIDQNLERIWLTGHGGGSYEESYELALYFMAHHTQHDAMDKRNRRGYLFLIGDEHAYSEVVPQQVKNVIGDTPQGGMTLREVVEAAQKLYDVFFIIPGCTDHFDDEELFKYWMDLLDQQHVLRLEEPENICDCIVGAVALSEGRVTLDDLATDGVVTGTELVELSRSASVVAARSSESLPTIPGDSPTVERL